MVINRSQNEKATKRPNEQTHTARPQINKLQAFYVDIADP